MLIVSELLHPFTVIFTKYSPSAKTSYTELVELSCQIYVAFCKDTSNDNVSPLQIAVSLPRSTIGLSGIKILSTTVTVVSITPLK